MSKNITLSADEALIERARERARQQHTTLNAVFREWLTRYVGEEDASGGYRRMMARMEGVCPGGRFDRDALNER